MFSDFFNDFSFADAYPSLFLIPCVPLFALRSPPPPSPPSHFFGGSLFSTVTTFLAFLLYLCNHPNSPLVTIFHHRPPTLPCTVNRASRSFLPSVSVSKFTRFLPFSTHYRICASRCARTRAYPTHVALAGPREHRVQMRVSRVNTRMNRTASLLRSCWREGWHTIIPIRSNREKQASSRRGN